MARRPRHTSEQIEATMLEAMSSFVKKNDAPSDIWFPSFDSFIWDKSIPEADRPARSALYRLWPSREDALNALVKHMLQSDLYNSAGISESHDKIAAGIKTEHESESRESVVLAMGKIAVKSTNHVVASRIESAASFRMNETPELEAVITQARDNYIRTLANGYESVHTRIGDSLLEGQDFETYARTVANTARGIGLNYFGLNQQAQETQYEYFLQIADRFTSN